MESETSSRLSTIETGIKQDFTYHNPLMTGNVPRPEKLKELLNCAERLAVGLPFARVDFYVL